MDGDIFLHLSVSVYILLILLDFEKYRLIYHQVFFVERAFKIFDRDGNGDISLAEFIDTMYQFAGKGQAEKILFLFKVYDIDGMCKHNSFDKLIIH